MPFLLSVLQNNFHQGCTFFFKTIIGIKIYFAKCKKIKQNWRIPENLYILFCVSFYHLGHKLFSEGETGH